MKILKPAFVKLMSNSFTKMTKKGCPLSNLQQAVKSKRKMAQEPDQCENSELYYKIEEFFNSERATIFFYV